MRKIFNKHGFTYDSTSKRVVMVEGDGDEGSNRVETPKKARRSKKAVVTSGRSKKRKLSDAGKEEQQDEVVLGGPVMKMETTPGIEEWDDGRDPEASDAY